MAAVEFGDHQVQLTSRGNLQLRGVRTGDDGEAPVALVDAVTRAGLLPSATHEMVRNIICSPLTGRCGGSADLRELVDELDDLLCSTPLLASLPGRFLFGLDDGRGDVLPLAHDLGLYAVGPGDATLTVGGRPGPVVALREAAHLMLALAVAFQRARGHGPSAAWHVGDLPDAGTGLWGGLGLDAADVPGPVGPVPSDSARPSDPARLGVLHQSNGQDLLVVGVPLGLLDPAQIRVAATAAIDAGSGELIVTPWRTLVIPDLRSPVTDLDALVADLEKAGLVTDPHSGRHGVSACTGAPGCASAAAVTRPIATLLATAGGGPDTRPVHVVACERRCGSPAVDHVEVLALTGSRQVVTRRPAAGGPSPSSPELVEHTSTTACLSRAVALARTAP
jgi:precorrin-3B synthase